MEWVWTNVTPTLTIFLHPHLFSITNWTYKSTALGCQNEIRHLHHWRQPANTASARSVRNCRLLRCVSVKIASISTGVSITHRVTWIMRIFDAAELISATLFFISATPSEIKFSKIWKRKVNDNWLYLAIFWFQSNFQNQINVFIRHKRFEEHQFKTVEYRNEFGLSNNKGKTLICSITCDYLYV